MEPGKKLKVLIVDDSKSIRMMLSDVVSAKFPSDDVIAVDDGQVAWGRIVQEQFDLIISDWNMPNMNGDELLKNIRGDERFEKVPFLMMTTRSDKESVVTAIKHGVTEYMVKPFDDDMVVQKIEKLLGIKASDQKDLEAAAKALFEGGAEDAAKTEPEKATGKTSEGEEGG